MTFIRTGLVIAALAAFPGAAHAWPIAFTWQLSGWTFPPPLQPGAAPAAGAIDFPAATEGTPGTGSYMNPYEQVSTGGTFGTGSYMKPYQGSLGNVTLSGYITQAPLTLSAPLIGFSQFGVNVTLTDWMSGQSASITAYGIAYTTWTELANGSWALESSIGSDGPQSLRLGNNLYTVWIDQVGSTPGSTAPIIAPVDVSVTPLATPEPGTLALAVCGFSLVGFRVRRLARGSTN